jgi:hypothetical protein
MSATVEHSSQQRKETMGKVSDASVCPQGPIQVRCTGALASCSFVLACLPHASSQQTKTRAAAHLL